MKIKSLLDKTSKVTELKNELLWAQVTEFEKVIMIVSFFLLKYLLY